MIDYTKLVHVTGDVWAKNQQIFDLVQQADKLKLPCGYAWATEEMISAFFTKEGQAETGAVVSRVRSFATTGRQIILDVTIDPFFNAPHQDKVLIAWRDENEKDVKRKTGVRTLEGMVYKNQQAFDELSIRRLEALRLITANPLAGAIECFLNTTQFEYAAKAITMFRNGSRKILADLCARFGKTIWSAVIARMLDVDIIIVSAYVKTVFASFGEDLKRMKQLVHFVHIDSSDRNYKTKITAALKDGKKIIVYLSLCPGGQRDGRIEFLGKIRYSKFWIVDEADYGAHQPKQVTPLKKAVKNDYLLIMTGTNADRAINNWNESFDLLGVTYLELLIQKNETAKELTK